MFVRRFLQLSFGMTVMTMVLVSVHGASAQEVWVARSGITTLHLNVGLMRDMGIQVTDVQDTVASQAGMGLRLEDPYWSFSISPTSDYRFQVNNGVAVPYGILGGALRHEGSLIWTIGTKVQAIHHLEVGYTPATVTGPGGPHPSDVLYLRGDGADSPVVCDISNSMFDFRPLERTLYLHYMNLSISGGWASHIGRPDLAGWSIGKAEAAVAVEKIGGASSGQTVAPNFIGNLDLALGNIDTISEVAHDGTYPNGTAAISMATTACNAGDTDIPWHAPMAVDHPAIAMALYRSMNGRLEQIGVSWMKHGFYGESNSDCTPCQHYSDGTFLGVGCSDTYGVNNNADRNYLGPRKEIDPYTGVWTCTGSYFSGYQPDCVRRQGGSGLGPLDHRLTALDSDLGLTGATYYYEGYYVLQNDTNKLNNLGSRICTERWIGSLWRFNTPQTDNPLVPGPTINRFGELRTVVPVGDGDGDVILAVQTTDLGGGRTNYEYALFNLDSDREIRALTIPVGAESSVTNIGFHDADGDPTDDWDVTLGNGMIRWETDTFENNPNAHALEYGLMYNFRFDTGAAPASGTVTLGVFKPTGPAEVTAATLAPAIPASVPDRASSSLFRLDPARPDPTTGPTMIPFMLARSAPIELSIYDSTGRRLRILMQTTLDAGAHQTEWDGRDMNGRVVAAGVYYYRLHSEGQSSIRSVTVLR